MSVFEGLPAKLALYLIAVSVLGPLFALGLAVRSSSSLGGGILLEAALLVVLAAAGERYQLHITHKTQLTLSATAHVAMVLVLPSGLPGLLALLAAGAGQASLFRSRHDPLEALFNAAQQGLYVALTAVFFGATKQFGWLGPQVGPFGAVGAIIGAALILYLTNTALITVCTSLQLGTRPWRIMAVTAPDDFIAHIVLCALGLVAAYVAVTEPVMIPVLAVPMLLMRRSIAANVQLREDIRAALENMVEAIELRDPYTAGHSRRVASFARTIALDLGLTNEEADTIESAGFVHDIGKIAIDPAILTKPGRLTDGERREMECHPGLGADFISRFASYHVGVPLVRHHHEAWDGSGYPDGLQNAAIPLGARILAVADTFDALTSDRPYRAGMTVDRAFEILREGAGRQWDATVVACLLRQPMAESDKLRRNSESAATETALRALPNAS